MKIITVVLALLFIRLKVNGCSVCFSNSEVFIDNLAKSPLVIHAKVIQQLQKQNSMFDGIDFDGITQLKVLHSFKGKLWTDIFKNNIQSSGSWFGDRLYQEQHLLIQNK